MYRLALVTYGILVSSAGVTFVFLEDIESDFGIGALGVGAVSSIGFVVTLLVALLVSPLGDRGHVMAIGAVGIATGIGGNLWLGVADELWSLLAARAIASFGLGAFGVATRKALIGESPDGSGEMLGSLVSFAVGGFLLGPALGSVLEGFGGIWVPYTAIAVALAIVALPVLRWLGAAPIAVSHTNAASMLPWLRRPRVRAAAAAQAAVFFNIGVFDSTVDEYLTSLGVSNNGVALVLIVVGSPLLIVPTFAGRAADSAQQPHRLLLVALFLFVPIVALIGVFETLIAFMVFAFCQTFMESVIFPSSARVVIDETGAEESAIGTGLLDAVGQIAAAGSALAAPTLFDLAGGPIGSFGMSAGVAAALLAYAASQVRLTTKTEVTPVRP